MKTAITRADLLDLPAYEAIRKEKRAALIEIKKKRRVHIGPHATAYFENYDTMWSQIQEMLRIEKGGDAQIDGELEAYNSLIPQGRELVATVMFEIDDENRRHRVLSSLGGVEDHFFLKVAGETIHAVPEDDVERTNADGKTSSVHFVHFPLSEAQAALVKTPGIEVVVGIDHENYRHMAGLSDESRAALAEDLA